MKGTKSTYDIRVTPVQLWKAACWTTLGLHMANVTLTLDGNKLTVAQGDEEAIFDPEGKNLSKMRKDERD